jgi:hypothetical protein
MSHMQRTQQAPWLRHLLRRSPSPSLVQRYFYELSVYLVSSKTKEGEKGKEKRVATEYKERKTYRGFWLIIDQYRSPPPDARYHLMHATT